MDEVVGVEKKAEGATVRAAEAGMAVIVVVVQEDSEVAVDLKVAPVAKGSSRALRTQLLLRDSLLRTID